MQTQRENKLGNKKKKGWGWRKDTTKTVKPSIQPEPDWPTQNGLRFTPSAWQKLLYMLHRGPTEVAGWGVVTQEDPLLVYGFHLLEQESSAASFEFTELGIERYRLSCLEAGLDPVESERILIHTHPRCGPSPSQTDEENFRENMGEPLPHWAVMFIIDRDHGVYARLQFNVGPGGSIKLGVSVDWSSPLDNIDTKEWDKEYDHYVNQLTYNAQTTGYHNSKKPNPYTQVGDDLFDPQDETHDDWIVDEHGVWVRKHLWNCEGSTQAAPIIIGKRYELNEREDQQFHKWLRAHGYDKPKPSVSWPAPYNFSEDRELIDRWQASVVKKDVDGKRYTLTKKEFVLFLNWLKANGLDQPPVFSQEEQVLVDQWQASVVAKGSTTPGTIKSLEFLSGPALGMSTSQITDFADWLLWRNYNLPSSINANCMAMVDQWRDDKAQDDSLEAERSLELEVIAKDYSDEIGDDAQEFETWIRDQGLDIPHENTEEWTALEDRFYDEMYGCETPALSLDTP